MLERVHIQRFRALRDVELRLGPVTILVGPNASGKTSILRALAWPHDWGVSQPRDAWRHQLEGPVIEGTFGGADFRLDADTWPRRPYSRQFLHLDLARLRQENVVAQAKQLAESGDNFANVFATLSRPQQSDVARELARLIPVVADLHARPRAKGQHRVIYQDRWDPNLWFEPEEVSDGTLLMAAFLTLQHQDPPPQVVAIEEPDRGLHPFLLDELLGFLRKLSTGEIGPKPVQIVLATHSPQLLEFARPEEVRFLRRKGEDVVIEEAPTTTPEWEEAFREYQESLGSLWLSGGLGGVPDAP